MTEIFILIALLIGIWLFKSSKEKKYPNRLLELEQAIQTQADLRLYRNKDAETSFRLTKLAEDLRYAQHLLNESSESVRSNWPRLRPQILHLTSESSLKIINVFYTDRREELKAAVYDLVRRLDKMENRETEQKK
ncbi:hypothetical protein [Hydrogenophaga sp.]|uniref:hypothetical protein n=1 Tax=Hydrogenophaga sp. TaxID=1904254 RepID=UPI002730432B|nr:hypothetical protein [Hydrogenophaga sp.]